MNTCREVQKHQHHLRLGQRCHQDKILCSSRWQVQRTSPWDAHWRPSDRPLFQCLPDVRRSRTGLYRSSNLQKVQTDSPSVSPVPADDQKPGQYKNQHGHEQPHNLNRTKHRAQEVLTLEDLSYFIRHGSQHGLWGLFMNWSVEADF